MMNIYGIDSGIFKFEINFKFVHFYVKHVIDPKYIFENAYNNFYIFIYIMTL